MPSWTMGDQGKQSVFKTTRLHCDTNNVDHHTSEASQDQLIVRRGQTFRLTLELTHPFQQKLHPLAITATTGPQPSEKQGTRAYLRIPALDPASTSAKAVWKMELDQSSSVSTGVVQLMVTPPADAPVGAYSLTAEHRGESAPLGRLVLLFNPWCPDDDVFLDDEEERGEYVMNEEGIIYKGSGNYITSMKWDYGQFEDNMVDICLKLLDMSHKHLENPAEDVSARCDPAYVGRVVSAMINSEDDNGVLKGQWSGPYFGGVTPSHWNSSHDILNKWFNIGCHPVKYGQCWVFAGVMCSVMRFLGIPCRVVTNYNSAHDTNGNLIVDVYHADYGVREKRTRDSVWNFHVWVEGWMRRPDLGGDGRFDGWQVLDPTPQEMSGGVYCCGPAPVKAIHDGDVHLDYDVPFVFAAVNADCVDWLVKADGSHVNIWADTKRVGHNISTKSVGSDKRRNITDTYKHIEGTEQERAVFKYACTRDQLKDKEGKKDAVSRPENGKDVNLKLVVTSNTSVALQLSINITVQAMRHNGTPAVNILSEVKEETLQPWKELSTSVLVPFLTYNQPMLQCESMKIEALVTNKQKPDQVYLAEDNVVLVHPPISLTINGAAKVNQEVMATMVFMNPVNVTLRNCSMTMSGSGLLPQELIYRLPDLKPQSRFTVRFTLSPFKSGRKTLALNFDCSVFRNIKAWCDFDVLP